MCAARVSALVIIRASAPAASAPADGRPLPGQSRHGAAFDRGPRFEPFGNIDFVLAESKRLLSRPLAPVEPGARVIPD